MTLSNVSDDQSVLYPDFDRVADLSTELTAILAADVNNFSLVFDMRLGANSVPDVGDSIAISDMQNKSNVLSKAGQAWESAHELIESYRSFRHTTQTTVIDITAI